MRWAAAVALVALAQGSASARTPQVGEPAPDFSVRTFDGTPLTLADFRGKVLLINYWATWCGPCKAELPLLEVAYRKWAGDGLAVIAVTTEDSLPKSSLRKLDAAMTAPMANHMKSKGSYAPIKGMVPTNFIIGRDGIVRYAKAGAFDAAALVDTLTPLLAEPVR